MAIIYHHQSKRDLRAALAYYDAEGGSRLGDRFGMEADRSLRADQPSDASRCKRITDTLMTHHHQTIGLVLAMLFPVAGHCAAADAPTTGFYKQSPLFSTAPAETASSQLIGRFGPVGIGIELVQPAFAMKVASIEKGSPAEATGKLKTGQLIETINGQQLAAIDPRIQLGQIITAAEAGDGAVKLMVKDTPEAKAEEVVVQIPVLGAYSQTWPLNCPKSDKIVRGFADYLAKPDSDQGFFGFGMLFLLSTGEDKDLAPVKQWVHGFAGKAAPEYAWHLGYGGIPLCEYYLRTGDPVALPVIQSWVKSACKAQFLGGWAGRGGVPAVTYGGGGAHLNAGGTAVVTFLMLAKECGADVPDQNLLDALIHFYRLAGRGMNPYGDNRPESSFVDNGKNGNLAFAMAAAASLTPTGEQSVYAAARDAAAMTSFYTTTYMLHGHTGGGIGEIWRSAAMGLLHEKKPAQYREFMGGRQWHYELSRRFDGSFAILGGDRYDNTEWGAGYALAYTIPRKKLRVAGAPLSQFAKPYQLPEHPWGTKADEAFISLEAAAVKDAPPADLSNETLAHDSGKPVIERLLAMGEISDDLLRDMAHHQDVLIRQLATKSALGIEPNYMWIKSGGKIRHELIRELMVAKDPRVRHAILAAIIESLRNESPEKVLPRETFDLLVGMIKNPDESWWVKDAAMRLVGFAPTDWVVPQVDLLLPYLKHEESWLQNAALSALAPAVADERCYQKVLPAIGELIRTCQRWNITAPVRGGTLPENLRKASPTVQQLAAAALKGAYTAYAGVKTAPGGQDLTTVYDSHLKFLAESMVGVEGGYDMLYEIAKQQFPNDPLPYREIFLAADFEKFGPALKQAITPIIRDQLIYETIGKNRAQLLAETNPAKPTYDHGRSLDGLIALYRKLGIRDYDWHAVSPDLKDATWDYHTFDPPEKMAYDISPWRYRPVTYPTGMENWFMPDFDPVKAGWKKGQPPFGQLEGKLVTDSLERRNPDCRATGPMRTLWDKEVLLVRGTFQFPPLKPGHLYRVRIESGQNVGSGDGYQLYLNGKPMDEVKAGVGRGAGGRPRGVVVNGEFAAEFANGPVTLAATTFLRYGDRAIVTMPPVPMGVFTLWLEEMKLPLINDEALRKSSTVIPMLSAAWQQKQDPNNLELQTDHDKFRYDGKFAANPTVSGSWTTVAVVPAIEAFEPAKPVDANRAPFKAVTFKDGGLTDSGARIWSGDTLMDLDRFQALKMTPKAIGATDYLFIEAGGFSDKNPAGWKSPIIVMKRADQVGK
jgi:hypothetical protein